MSEASMNACGDDRYPPIADYALISDCHCAALISRNGSIDWCCMPSVDADSCFGRLLDWEKGGHCTIRPGDSATCIGRRYLPGTMVLETTFASAGGQARLFDFFMMDADNRAGFDLVRVLEGTRGEVRFALQVAPRFDYGEIIPRLRKHAPDIYAAVGSNKGLIFRSDVEAEVIEHRDLAAEFAVHEGQRIRFAIHFEPPEMIDDTIARGGLSRLEPDGGLERTRLTWCAWSDGIHPAPNTRNKDALDALTMRSAIVLKALTVERTGAIVAAPTASLPEWIGGVRNWDYRFSWVRDSVFMVRALYQLGCETEAERFMRFVQRSCAGSAAQLQIMYGVDGKRRLTEIELEWLEGYRGSKPVRIGNFAAKQNQLDVYGEVMELAWEWYRSGHDVEPDYWSILASVVDMACASWRKRDFGIWEFRGGPRHHVYSKAMCWSALDYGIRLAQEYGFDAPLERWQATRDAIRATIERHGFDRQRGIFVQAFGNRYLDASLLLLPRVDLVAYDDPRMVRTVDAICSSLDRNGLLARYDSPDGLPGDEGVFLPCTFWLARCLAYQGRHELARRYYERAVGCANDLGLFSEEFDTGSGCMLGNFPLGLTHVSQIMARLALAETAQ
jgi:GH15 family glucan-1,4-alpha-glucosidase